MSALRRPSSRLTAGGAAVALLCAVSCGGPESPAPAARARAQRSGVPGVVLLCMDTLRADGPSLDAGAPGAMPALERFAREGAAFADAVAPAAWTAPSVSTLLTGLNPSHTGVRGALSASGLVSSVPTLAKRLHEEGFSTWGFSGGGWVAPERGCAQGFDSFTVDFDTAGPEASIARWQHERPKDAPFFLFLHTYAAHDPYGPKGSGAAASLADPGVAETARAYVRDAASNGGRVSTEGLAWFLERYLNDPAARDEIGRAIGGVRGERLWESIVQWLDEAGSGSPALLEVAAKARTAYRSGLSFADGVFARTLAALDAAGVPKDAAVIVVGDHGEAFGEHGTLSHGRWLYDEIVRVPLVVRAPGRVPAGLVVRGSCGLVDVGATVLDLAGLGKALGDGASLVSLAAGTTEGRPVVAEEERRVVRDGTAEALRTVSVRTPAAKWLLTYEILTLRVVAEEVYDLAADPGEARSLAPEAALAFGPAFAAAVARSRPAGAGASSAGATVAAK